MRRALERTREVGGKGQVYIRNWSRGGYTGCATEPVNLSTHLTIGEGSGLVNGVCQSPLCVEVVGNVLQEEWVLRPYEVIRAILSAFLKWCLEPGGENISLPVLPISV